jgi:hypothetical protein
VASARRRVSCSVYQHRSLPERLSYCCAHWRRARAASTAEFGPQIWHAFLDSTRFTRIVALEQGNTGWYKSQSVFSWAHMWGASIHLAYALQGALTGVLVKLWHGAAPYALKAAALCFAPILATPYTTTI